MWNPFSRRADSPSKQSPGEQSNSVTVTIPNSPDATLYGDTELTVFGPTDNIIIKGIVTQEAAEAFVMEATDPMRRVILFEDPVHRCDRIVFVDAITHIQIAKIR